MTEKDINKCLKNGISEIAPDCLDDIMEKLSAKDDKSELVRTKQKWLSKKTVGYLASMAAFFAVLVGSYGCYQHDLHKVTTVVELDVNPSIEFCADKSDKVVKVKALNDDGETILENLSLEDKDVKKATLEVMDELVDYGFITKEKSTVLVSVENKNQDKTEEIKESLSKEIKEHLQKEDIEITVLKQTITKDEVSENIAKEYNISKGKALLVKTVMEENSDLKEEELAQMTVDELKRQAEGKDSKAEATKTPTESLNAEVTQTSEENREVEALNIPKGNKEEQNAQNREDSKAVKEKEASQSDTESQAITKSDGNQSAGSGQTKKGSGNLEKDNEIRDRKKDESVKVPESGKRDETAKDQEGEKKVEPTKAPVQEKEAEPTKAIENDAKIEPTKALEGDKQEEPERTPPKDQPQKPVREPDKGEGPKEKPDVPNEDRERRPDQGKK